ncbi:hypothetical protein L7F22_025633 [Adiantum nelumboides]|nr:hypothetical protein [Adiantum nelumboides]
MRALTWHGRRDVRVDTVPDPVIERPDDVVVQITSSGLCGSDLHLYEVLAPFLTPGDVLGHEPMGVVAELRALLDVRARPAVPVRDHPEPRAGHRRVPVRLHRALRAGARRAGRVPAGAVRQLAADPGAPGTAGRPVPVPVRRAADGVPGRAVRRDPADGTLVVLGLGPIGDMCTRIAAHLGVRQVVGVDLVPERLARVEARGVTALDLGDGDDEVLGAIRSMTRGRGADAVIDAVGMEAHGSPVAATAQKLVSAMPSGLGRTVMETAGSDRTAALELAIGAVRRGGTISLSGVYGGSATPLPMLTLFDKQVQMRMGQANVWRWVPDLLPLLGDDDPLGVDHFATHRVPLEEAAQAYSMFQDKTDGAVKVLFTP